jgi:hypothetical protein
LLAVAIVNSILLSRWIGGAGVIVGAISIIAGIEVAYVGFGYTNFVGLRGISMIIYFIWVGVIGVFMWRLAKDPIPNRMVDEKTEYPK